MWRGDVHEVHGWAGGYLWRRICFQGDPPGSRLPWCARSGLTQIRCAPLGFPSGDSSWRQNVRHWATQIRQTTEFSSNSSRWMRFTHQWGGNTSPPPENADATGGASRGCLPISLPSFLHTVDLSRTLPLPTVLPPSTPTSPSAVSRFIPPPQAALWYDYQFWLTCPSWVYNKQPMVADHSPATWKNLQQSASDFHSL